MRELVRAYVKIKLFVGGKVKNLLTMIVHVITMLTLNMLLSNNNNKINQSKNDRFLLSLFINFYSQNII
jgi:hypothetical protein